MPNKLRVRARELSANMQEKASVKFGLLQATLGHGPGVLWRLTSYLKTIEKFLKLIWME